MKTTLLFSTLFSASLMTSCVVVEPDAGGGSTAPTMSSEGSDAGSPGWQRGYQQGLSDGRSGLSRTPDRGDFSEADRAEFFSGYESGYNRGIRP